MKPIRIALVGIALLFSAAWTQAQETPPPIVPQVQPAPPPLVQPPGGNLISAKGLEKLNLTKEQKADYDKLNAEYKDKQKVLQGKLLDPMAAPDPIDIKGLFEARQKLRPDYLAKVEKLLTDDQKKTFEEVRREAPGLGIGGGLSVPLPIPPFGPVVGGAFLPADAQQRLKLSDEQKKKVDDLQKELETKILGLLTEDQRKQFDEMKKQRIGFPGSILPPPPPLELPKLPPPGVDPLPPPLDPARPPEVKKIEN